MNKEHPKEFRSNADMVRYYFKKLMEDGKEHSAKEINQYIHNVTGSCGVGGKRLTDETIHSAIWYMFRNNHDYSYTQIRKGIYQKNSADNLLGDAPNSFRGITAKVLFDAKERIRQYTAVPELPEQEQRKLNPLRQTIMSTIDDAINTVRTIVPDQTVMTKDSLAIDSELLIEEDHINAYLAVWFDTDKRFNLHTKGTDEYVTLCADYYPADERLEVYYIHHAPDGSYIDIKDVDNLSDNERKLILQLMKDEGLDDCIMEMNEKQSPNISMEMGGFGI